MAGTLILHNKDRNQRINQSRISEVTAAGGNENVYVCEGGRTGDGGVGELGGGVVLSSFIIVSSLSLLGMVLFCLRRRCCLY